MEHKHGTRSGLWTYEDACGNPVGVIVRWDPVGGGKVIRPASLIDGVWIPNRGMLKPRPLYRLPTLAGADRVYVCEGEKAADAAIACGLMATTCAHGANGTAQTDWSPFSGKDVVILPDHDEAGERYTDDVIERAREAGARLVRVVCLVESWVELQDGGDLVDVLEMAGGDGDGVRAVIEDQVARTEPIERNQPSGRARFVPFPVDALPESMRALVTEGSDAIICDPSMIALPALAVAGAAIGNSRSIKIKEGWIEHPTIWSAVVARSGSAKTPAMRLVTAPIRSAQSNAFIAHKKAMEDYAAEFKAYNKRLRKFENTGCDGEPPKEPIEPICKRYHASDITMEALGPILRDNPRGILIPSDEFARWMKSFNQYRSGGGDCEAWLSIFDGGEVLVDRKTGTKTIYVPSARVCVTGTIQPESLDRILGDKYLENGLAARVLFANPLAQYPRYTDRVVSSLTITGWADAVDRLLSLQPSDDGSGHPEPILVELAPDAHKVFVELNDELADRIESAGSDCFAAALSKLRAYGARLALIHHLVNEAGRGMALARPAKIGIESARAGATLARWFANEAERMYATSGDIGLSPAQLKLLDYIQGKGGSVTVRELTKGLRTYRGNSAKASAALEGLAQAGLGTWQTPRVNTQGGRPTRRFVIFPNVRIANTPCNDAVDGDIDDGGARASPVIDDREVA